MGIIRTYIFSSFARRSRGATGTKSALRRIASVLTSNKSGLHLMSSQLLCLLRITRRVNSQLVRALQARQGVLCVPEVPEMWKQSIFS